MIKCRRKIGLEETWRKCLDMWMWIAEVFQGNCAELTTIRKDPLPDTGEIVAYLKRYYLRMKRERKLRSRCYFCDYKYSQRMTAEQVEKQEYTDVCQNCPGSMVDGDFDCQDAAYHFSDCPVRFYEKLVQLNNIRLSNNRRA
jgi:hypothetical protein